MGRAKTREPEKASPPAERVREDFVWVYERLGGRDALLRWAEENAKEFFKTFFGLLQRPTAQEPDAGELVRALQAISEAEGE
jgi:hypothetical protein